MPERRLPVKGFHATVSFPRDGRGARISDAAIRYCPVVGAASDSGCFS